MLVIRRCPVGILQFIENREDERYFDAFQTVRVTHDETTGDYCVTVVWSEQPPLDWLISLLMSLLTDDGETPIGHLSWTLQGSGGMAKLLMREALPHDLKIRAVVVHVAHTKSKRQLSVR